MAKVKTVKRCYLCGAVLQNDNPNQTGYVASEKLLQAPISRVLYCDKCYNDASFCISRDEPSLDKDYREMITHCARDNALIVLVIDLFSFEASINRDVIEILKNNRVVIIGNKLDLLPADVNLHHLKLYVGQYLRDAGLWVSNDDVFLVSLSGCERIDNIVKHIESLRNGKDVYIAGSKGAGKSLFCSSFLRSFENKSNDLIVTTNYPNTNLRLMRVPLGNNSYLYDTPGSNINNNIVSKLENDISEELKQFADINCRHYKLEPGDAIFIGGLGIIELVSSNEKHDRESVRAYFPPCVKTKKKSNKKITQEYFEKCLERDILVPNTRYVRSIKDFDILDVTIEERGQRDIGIAGLGWISFQGNKQVFRCYVPKGVSVYTTRGKIYVNE